MLKKPNAIRKEGDIECDDEATVGNNAAGAERANDDGVAQKSGVVENEGELGFVAETAFEPPFVENEFGEDNEDEHDKDARDKTGKKEVQGGFVVFGRESDEKRSGHKDSEEEIGDLLVGLYTDEFFLAKEKTKNQNETNGAEAGIKLR